MSCDVFACFVECELSAHEISVRVDDFFSPSVLQSKRVLYKLYFMHYVDRKPSETSCRLCVILALVSIKSNEEVNSIFNFKTSEKV